MEDKTGGFPRTQGTLRNQKNEAGTLLLKGSGGGNQGGAFIPELPKIWTLNEKIVKSQNGGVRARTNMKTTERGGKRTLHP